MSSPAALTFEVDGRRILAFLRLMAFLNLPKLLVKAGGAMPLGSGGNFYGTQGSGECEIALVRRTEPNVLPFENGCKRSVKVEKRALNDTGALSKLAEPTGLEPATSDVTGRRSNQLNYDSAGNLNFQAARTW